MPRPSNGYMRCTRRKIRGRFPLGTKCKLKCRNGYTPSGYMRKKCVETGYWVGTDATCEDEKRLRVVTSKSTTTTTVLFNDELFYYKYLALKPHRYAKRVFWKTKTNLLCTHQQVIPSFCPTLLSLQHGTIEPSLCRGGFGNREVPDQTICRFECNSGYKLIGRESLTCNGTGSHPKWKVYKHI